MMALAHPALIETSRELLAAIGWATVTPDFVGAAPVIDQAKRLDPEVFDLDTHRRIFAVLLEQIGPGRGTTWSRTLVELQRRGDDDACEELVHVATAEGWPGVVHGHVRVLTEAADARKRWRQAVAELERLAGAPVRVELDG
ncbi:MAG: hypothetical protein M3O70_15765 [Actinomycetota bacterium]|nr:hypothetical protein [Actinomycetota bacterium]